MYLLLQLKMVEVQLKHVFKDKKCCPDFQMFYKSASSTILWEGPGKITTKLLVLVAAGTKT